MSKLKTNKNDLEKIVEMDIPLIDGGKLGLQFRKELLHDALHAHTLEARIDKVLAMKPPTSGMGNLALVSAGERKMLKEIQSLLGGE